MARTLDGIDSVELGELPDPRPAAGQALIRVRSAGVGLWDVRFLGGGFPAIALPFVPDWRPIASPGVVDTSAQSRPIARPLIHRPPSEIGFSVSGNVVVYVRVEPAGRVNVWWMSPLPGVMKPVAPPVAVAV